MNNPAPTSSSGQGQAPQADASRPGSGVWKWVLIVLPLFMAVTCVGGALMGFFDVFGRVRNHEVYKQGFELVSNDPLVLARLGEPVEPGWVFSGSFNQQGDTETAMILFHLHGPKQSASVMLTGTLGDDGWVVDTALVYPSDAAEGEGIFVVGAPDVIDTDD